MDLVCKIKDIHDLVDVTVRPFGLNHQIAFQLVITGRIYVNPSVTEKKKITAVYMDEGSPAYYISECHFTVAKQTYIEGIMCLCHCFT